MYRQGLAEPTTTTILNIREAIREDLEDEFLPLFPDHPQAQAMRALLVAHLEEREQAEAE